MPTVNKSLKSAITVVKQLDSSSKLPYCTGTFPWDEDKSTLFYKEGSAARFLKFPATDSQLASLFNACSAGKIEPSLRDFGMFFSPHQEGLIGVLEDGLIHHLEPKKIKVELSQLSVYGPGGSFDALNHTDTPASKIIAFLIVILPTVYEGGSLILRHGKKEYNFDSSKAVSATSLAQAAFIGSYSNVKHKMKPVTSGYLVMLTYNLYLKKDGETSRALTFKQENEPELKETFDLLLKDPVFFPDGGFIGFGLSHKYPFVVESTKLAYIAKGLKGSDATIRRACEGLSLDVSVNAVCYDEGEPERAKLMDDPSNYNYQVASIFDHLAEFGAKSVANHTQNGSLKSDHDDEPIAWLRPLGKTNRFTFFYILEDYKRPSRVDVNAYLCLVARIPPAEERDLPSGPNKKRRLDTST